MTMHNPAHPGEILMEHVIEPMGLTITDVATHLELAFKNPAADHWLNLQNAYDLWHVREVQSLLAVQPFLARI